MTILAALLAIAAVGATAAAVHFARRARGTADAPTPVASETTTEPIAADDDPEAVDGRAVLERLTSVVDQLEHAVVLWDGSGQEIFRNAVARAMFEARDGQVLVAAAIEELKVDALAGHHVRREVDLFGPPAASFVVVARPFTAAAGTDGPQAVGSDVAETAPAAIDGAVALVEDRSAQRRTETVRRDFVANISHELKTPIGALGLLAETVRDEPDPVVVERLADRMIVEADRVGRTVDDLLELSSIELGDGAEFEDLEVRSLVGEAESRLGSAAEQAGVTVRVDVPSGLVLNGDRRQLVSALFNLLDNAVKYSGDGSEVLVDAHDDPADGVLRLTVADSGIGVPRRDLDRVFERFYRVDRARSRRTGGTGLGLAIVRHVVSNHGGEVLVESTEGVGSSFTLVLPRPDTPAAPASHQEEP